MGIGIRRVAIISAIRKTRRVFFCNVPKGASRGLTTRTTLDFLELRGIGEILSDSVHPLLGMRMAVPLEMRKDNSNVVIDVFQSQTM